MSDLEIFLKSAKTLQSLNTNKLFTLYLTAYKKIFEKFLRKSSVSISFRIRLNKEYQNHLRTSYSNLIDYKRRFESSLKNFLKDDMNYLKTLSTDDTRILNIKCLKNFLQLQSNEIITICKNKNIIENVTTNPDEIFQVDILFIKRAASQRDTYSGHIAFPGGKYEKIDTNDYNTAIRETKEEIGIDLNSKFENKSEIISSYIGPNINYEITMDYKHVVISHLFVIFDLFEECEEKFVISEKELSDVFFVPLNYFLDVYIDNRNSFVKMISYKLFGYKVSIGKLILNNDDNFLLFGLTLRKILNFFNSNRENIRHSDFYEFENKGGLNFLRKFGIMAYFYFFKVLTNPVKSFKMIRNLIVAIVFYYGIIYLSNIFFDCVRSKF